MATKKRDQPWPSSTCSGCGTQDPPFLHNIRYTSYDPRFCTNCLLKNHPHLFCPICYDVYDHPPPPRLRLTCLRCPSIAHRSCVLSSHYSPSSSFRCPSCSNPNFSFFNSTIASNPLNETVKSKTTIGKGDPVSVPVQNSPNSAFLDRDSARALVAAARIAAALVSKAAAEARAEAELRAREAVFARKRAREALDRVAVISSRGINGSVTLVGDHLKVRPEVDNHNRIGIGMVHKPILFQRNDGLVVPVGTDNNNNRLGNVQDGKEQDKRPQ